MQTRSGRKVVRPSRFGPESPPESRIVQIQPLEPKDKVGRFMGRLYAEIYAATKSISDDEKTAMRHLLRQARLRRFFDLLSDPDARRAFDMFRPQTQDQHDVIQRARHDLNGEVPNRVSAFCKELNLVILSICAHSKTFRTVLTNEDDSELSPDLPKWATVWATIKLSAASLELFAKTRALPEKKPIRWEKPLRAHEGDFAMLLNRVFQGLEDVRAIDKRTFGIGPRDMDEVHSLNGDAEPHHWFLLSSSQDPQQRGAAVRCTVEYQVSDDLRREYPGVDGNDDDDDDEGWGAVPDVGDLQVVPQRNVEASIVLANYSYGDLPEAAHGDPRFGGYRHNPCDACGREQESDAVTWTRSSRFACKCEFKELCKTNGSDPGVSVFLELFDTGRIGTGVRALQDIGEDSYVGEYVCELYPRRTDGNGNMLTRYAGDEGRAYVFDQEIARPSDFGSDAGDDDDDDDDYLVGGRKRSKRARKTRGSKKAAAKANSSRVTKRSRRGGGEEAPSGRARYILDSAVRGDFTRYLNHSCKANTQFTVVNVGQRQRIVVQALQPIYWGDELTVDYGNDYFQSFPYGCKCGHATCKFWPEGLGDKGNKTLKVAKSQGVAPRWAMDDPDIPWKARKQKR